MINCVPGNYTEDKTLIYANIPSSQQDGKDYWKYSDVKTSKPLLDFETKGIAITLILFRTNVEDSNYTEGRNPIMKGNTEIDQIVNTEETADEDSN